MIGSRTLRARAAGCGFALLALLAAGCGPQIGVGSDVLWTALFEGDSFAEWTGLTGGSGYSFKAYAINSVGTTYTTPVSTFE